MVTVADLVKQIMDNIDKVETHGVQNMIYIVKCYQDLVVVKEGIEKMEKELEDLRGKSNNFE